ncbi:hypothetical protein HYX06_04175 [Candidatus Woesearchaeota archaeon]|nr:hypothetical protein [Candidatus Woesearchaeota archaeon]
MKSENTPKLIFVGSWIVIFLVCISLYVKLLRSSSPIEGVYPTNTLMESVTSITIILIVYGIVGLIYIYLKNIKLSLKKVWMIFGILIYIFNLLPWLLLVYLIKSEITSKNSDVGGLGAALFIGGWIQFGILILMGYILATVVYWIFKKMRWKTK